MEMRSGTRLLLATSALAVAAAAHAAGSVTYTYDPLGRLVAVAHPTGPSAGVASTYTYDPAGNRSNVTVTGVGATPPPPSFSVSDATVTESGALVFTVTKSGTTASTFGVNFATADGTAGAGDYMAASGTLTFAPGESAKTVTVATTADSVDESNETISLNLSGPTGSATISDGQGVGTIVDDDDPPPPPPSFGVSDATVTEAGSLVFTVTKTGAASSSFSVNYGTANGTAGSGDYAAVSGTLAFASGETSKTVTVATTADSVDESNETVLLDLSGASGGATISDSQGVGTIVDDDDPAPPAGVTFSVNSVTGYEHGYITFTVTKSGTATGSHSVSYATSSGSATTGSDFIAKSGTLNFSATATSKTVAVQMIYSSGREPNEIFYLTLSSPMGGATINVGTGTGTILDID